MHIAIAAAEGVDSRSSKTLFDNIKRTLQLLFKQIVDHCIIRPAVRLVLIINLREEQFELSIARMDSRSEDDRP